MQRCLPYLRNLPLFQDALVSDLEVLARSASLVSVRGMEVLFRSGDACTGFYVVIRGKIKLSLMAPQGGEKPLLFIEPGGSFGDLAMFLNRSFYVDGQALENSLLIFLPRSAIVSLIQHDSGFALRMLASLASRMYRVVNDIASFTLYPPGARLPLYLLRLVPQGMGVGQSCRIDLNVSKKTIAAQLNLTPATLSRHFKSLSNRGVLACRGRVVMVRDVELLRLLCTESPLPVSPGEPV